MGLYTIKMPDIGEGIAEVELVAWHVKEGDVVSEDQMLADVMTDKASVEIPSPVAGKVLALGGKVGEMMAVGSELIRLEVEGAGNVKAGEAPAERAAAQVATASAAKLEAAAVAESSAPAQATAAPAAKAAGGGTGLTP
ncbi:MAG: 2-oxo acid dehydrogenase subunit E2, partial [Burkholderiales bacterium]